MLIKINFVKIILLSTLVIHLSDGSSGRPTKINQKPNIILIVSDDVGFEEIGCYGVLNNPSKTPNIDRMADNGVRFNICYAQAICGPSRAMLYTGNYATHNGQFDNKLTYLSSVGEKINQRRSERQEIYDRLPLLTRVVKDAGYDVAWAGKWHHSTITGGFVHQQAERLGIDTYIEWTSNPSPYEKILNKKLTPDDTWEFAAISGGPIISRYWKPGLIKNGKVLETTMNDYGPDIFTDFICDIVKNHKPNSAPFFAMYAMNLAHSAHCITPLEVAAGEKPSNKHIRKGTPEGTAIFNSQVKYMDQLVGKIIDTVHMQGLDKDTIIIYTSDNGTTSSAKGKGVEYGVHVPFIVSGHDIKKRISTNELMDFTDILPTIAEWVGADLSDKSLDGKSLASFLSGEVNTTKDAIYSFPGPVRLIRTKTHLLEALSPLYNQPEGKFYETNGSFDGRGYKNVTHNKDAVPMREYFSELLAKFPSTLPLTFDDPVWSREEMQKGKDHFYNDRRKRLTLQLPKNYSFYDDSL